MKHLSKFLLSLFILLTLVACGDSKKVDKEKIKEELYITFTETEITIAKDSEFQTDSIIVESNGEVSLPNPIDTTILGTYELIYVVSSTNYPEIKKEYIITVFVNEDLSKEVLMYEITEVNITCGEGGSGISFDADGTVWYGEFEFSTSTKGTYTQVAENVYELKLPNYEDLKYFVFNKEGAKAYFYLDNSLSLEELNNYTVISKKTGCGVVDSEGNGISNTYSEE